MSTAELLKRVRKIEIKTKRLSQQVFAGEYHSAFKGRGMAFSEVREYQFGDDVRTMDWNVTARLNTPYVKVYEEERELTVMLLIDVSGSRFFGSTVRTKREVITVVAAVLSFSASANNDKVGALLFSSKVEKFIPPKKGRSHLLRIIRELLNFEPEESGTDLSEALRYLTNVMKKSSTTFLISDMLDVDSEGAPQYEQALRISAGRHDLHSIVIYDKLERELPNVGLIKVSDSESGEQQWIDTSRASVRREYAEWNREVEKMRNQLLNRYQIPSVSIATDQDYVIGLMTLFNK